MKLKFSGGQASRAEVYGLFVAAVVLVGGGIGGAYAVTTSITQAEVTATESATPTATPEEVATAEAANEASTESGSGSTDAGSNSGSAQQPDAPTGPGPNYEPFQPVIPPEPVDTRIQEPYIGPADTFSYLSRNYICGWDTAALGGFGWGFDPAEPCNEEFKAYIGQHCEANDGIVFDQRCEEYFDHRLPIAY